jgi:hypothetical protein
MATKTKKKLRYEILTLDELTERYVEEHKLERAEGYGATTIDGHFRLAFLFLQTQEYKILKNTSTELLFAVRPNSIFSRKSLDNRAKNPGERRAT